MEKMLIVIFVIKRFLEFWVQIHIIADVDSESTLNFDFFDGTKEKQLEKYFFMKLIQKHLKTFEIDQRIVLNDFSKYR